MRNRKRNVVGVAALVATLGIGGAVAFGGGSSAQGTVLAGSTIYMVVDKAGTATDAAWGPSVPNPCSSLLGTHVIELASVTGGLENASTLSAAAKLRFDSVVIKKAIDSTTDPLALTMEAGTAVNLHLYFFTSGASLNCARPEMKLDLIGALAGRDVQNVDQGDSSESVTLSFGLEALRTSSVTAAGVWSWDGGFCFDVVTNVACNAASVPLKP